MIRTPVAPAAHHDHIVYLAQAAVTGPPWLAIALAAIALLSAVGVALAPALVERVKRNRPLTEPAALPAPPAASGAVDLTGEALRDAWAERDEAQQRAEALQRDLTAALAENTKLQVQVTRKQARIEWLESVLGGQFGTGRRT